MKIVIDTNVFVSGIFWSGPPYQILKAWNEGKLKICLTPEILREYTRVADKLYRQYHSLEFSDYFDLLAVSSEMYSSPELPLLIPDDPSDDKFIGCALAANSKYIISGDKHLLNAADRFDIEILKPKSFVEKFLIKKTL